MLTVIVHPQEPGHDRRTLPFSSDVIVLGRGDDCDVHIDDNSVSRHHAVLQLRDERYWIIDQGSANGIHFGAQKLESNAPHAVTEGDFFRIGDVLVEIRFSLEPPSFASACSTREMAMGLVDHLCRVRHTHAGPRLVGIDGPDKGQILNLTDDAPRVLGRSRTSDLPLADHETSRRHVEVRFAKGRLSVRDLGSENGAELAGTRLAPGEDVEWKAGATLRLASSVFVFQYEAETVDELTRDVQEDQFVQPAAMSASLPTDKAIEAFASSSAVPVAITGRDARTGRKRRLNWRLETVVLIAVVGGGVVFCASLIFLLFS